MKRAIVGGLALLLLAAPALAHETKQVGPLTITIGWGTEPPYSGHANSIDVGLTRTDGAAVDPATVSLVVQVAFGEARLSLPLTAGDRPGLYRARLVPTHAGAYAFLITGTVGGQAVDVAAACSGASFDCVVDADALQFPAKDPPSGQLLARLDRERARATEAASDARTARRLAVIALVVAVVGVAAGLRRRR